MMDQLTDEEKFLLLGKVTGTLSLEEQEALEQLFHTNPYARPAYEELTAALPAEDVANAFARRKAHTTWKDLASGLRQERQLATFKTRIIPLYTKKWIAAVAITAILMTGALVWQQFYRLNEPEVATIPAKPGIELKLANGQVINLSQQRGNINTGTVQLNNNNKSLTYATTTTTNNSSTAIAANTLTVPVGLDYKINLADGSEIWLNSATRLDFPLAFTGNTREITINGEAYLKVAKNAAKPFIVHLPNSTVQVLGTEFNVNSYDSGVVRVALAEGSVNMKTLTGETELSPGRQAIYHAGQPIEQEDFDARRVLSWRKGLFYFNNASLEEISRVVPRWYGIQVAIDDPAILSRRFTGVIDRNRPIDVFVEDMKVISGIDARVNKNGVLHFK